MSGQVDVEPPPSQAEELKDDPSDTMSNGEGKEIWSQPIEKLYGWAIQFYKQEKDNLGMTYEERVQLLAYYKHGKYGKYSPDKDGNIGYFDVVGQHRRKKWQELGDTEKEEVQQKFIQLIDSVAKGAFKKWALEKIAVEEEAERRRLAELEAQRRAEEEERLRREEEERQRLKEEQRKKQEVEEAKKKEESNKQPTKEVTSQQEVQENTDGTSKDEPTLQFNKANVWRKSNESVNLISELQDSTANVLVVARSEMACVKVDTSDVAAGIFWEFCTESYDIGFGLSFKQQGRNEEIEVIPISRMECSVDVAAGNHYFTTPGTYFLKFDNTYSMFRSKRVFYRVFYCKAPDEQ